MNNQHWPIGPEFCEQIEGALYPRKSLQFALQLRRRFQATMSSAGIFCDDAQVRRFWEKVTIHAATVLGHLPEQTICVECNWTRWGQLRMIAQAEEGILKEWTQHLDMTAVQRLYEKMPDEFGRMVVMEYLFYGMCAKVLKTMEKMHVCVPVYLYQNDPQIRVKLFW